MSNNQQQKQPQQQRQPNPNPNPNPNLVQNASSNHQTLQLLPQQARQLLLQLNIEKEAAQKAGTDTIEGQEHIRKAEKIRLILISYNRRQKQQQNTNSNSSIPSNFNQENLNNSLAAPQLQNHTSNINQSSTNINIPNTGNNEVNKDLSTADEKSQAHRQQLLGRYQQIMRMTEQFKKNLAIIEARKADSNISQTTLDHCLDKEREIKTRLEHCRKAVQQIAVQIQEGRNKFGNSLSDNKNAVPAKTPIQMINQKPQLQAQTQLQTQSHTSNNNDLLKRSQASSLNSIPGANEPLSKKMRITSDIGTAAIAANTVVSNTPFLKDNHTLSSDSSSTDKPKFEGITIPEKLNVNKPEASLVRINNRPSMLNGNAINSPALANSSFIRAQPLEIEGERVLNKRKLKELVRSIQNEEGDTEINMDGDVEDLLLDLADEFITSVTLFARRLATNRHSDNLDVRDIQLHLERNWNIRLPGYATDEIRMIRKFVPNAAHDNKLNGISINKSVNKMQ